jgi:predicted nucleotide-binding protein
MSDFTYPPPEIPSLGLPPPGIVPSAEATPVLQILRNLLPRAERFAANPTVRLDAVQTLTTGLRKALDRIYGNAGPHQTYFAPLSAQLSSNEVHALAATRVTQIRTLIATLERLTNPVGDRVFIGHGRSPLWRELKDFIQDHLHLQWDEFNREPVAGQTTSERLDDMLSQAGFAFLVMTAEEERADATVHARDNVIHELGLFQGKLSRARAIILIEDGCAEFSNISGLSQIRFPKGDISARFEHVRRVLAREGFLE